MKEFNLELAKAGHPVQTRDGRNARIICYDRKSKDKIYPIVALIDEGNGEENSYLYTQNGYYYDNRAKNELDLVMASTKKEGWINIYINGSVANTGIGFTSNIYRTKQEALECKSKDSVATTKIEWEE